MLSDPGTDCVVRATRWTGRQALDAERLIARALAAARRTAFSDSSFLGPLKRLLTACEQEAGLSSFGRYGLWVDITRSLANVLCFDAAEELNPSLRTNAISAPLFVTGMPRSGTTFLHTLLAQDPESAVPRAWQLMYPYPNAGRILRADLRKLKAELQLSLFRLFSREIGDLHPLAADTPQECTDITAQVFQSLRFDSTYRIPSYHNWVRMHGHRDAYRFHRRFLAHLDAQTPGRRWILKSPDHVFALDAIADVYPDARLVFLHRDPVDVLASVLKLTEVLRRPFTHRVDREEIGEQVSAYWVDGSNCMIAAAASGARNILHLHYQDLIVAPLETVRRIYSHRGLSLGGEAEQRMTIWLERYRRNAPRRRYSLAEFGLEAESLRRRFARYIATFGIGRKSNPVELARQHAA